MKSFSQFINEAKNWASAPYLYKHYEPKFSEFRYEKDSIPIMFKLEQELQKIGDNYWWNRERRNWNKPHFAINAKVYVFPELDKVRNLINDPDLHEDRMYDIFYAWLNEIREMFAEDIKESYDWIEAVGWGGNSGGWLLISPELTYDNIMEEVNEVADYYISERNELMNHDPEEYLEIKELINSEDWNNLHELGLIDVPYDFSTLMDRLIVLNKNMNYYIDEIKRMDTDMEAIKESISKFSETGEDQFYTYLEQDYID